MFDGEEENYQVYWTKFRAFATAKGFIPALLGRDANLPTSENAVLDETVDTDKPKIKARKANSLAMAYLLSSFKAEADISLAYETMDDDWPGGLAYKVVEKLKGIYQPKDSVTEVELYTRLMTVKMKTKEDPKTLFEQIATIQNWYTSGTTRVPKEQLIAVVLRAAPTEYASVLTSEQGKRGTGLEVSHLRVVMNQYYRAVYKKLGGSSSKGDDEMSLAGQDYKNKESGGKWQGKKKFSGNCHSCGKKGHRASDCWADPKNAGKRPQWFKGNEIAGAAQTGGRKSDELQLVNMSWGDYADQFEEKDDFDYERATEELKNEKLEDEEHMLRMAVANKSVTFTTKRVNEDVSLLEDPDIFVIDTGATTHSTGNGCGMTELKGAEGRMTKVGNGERISTKAIGKLPVVMDDGTKANISDLHLIPGAPFNLMSGTKLLSMGYKMIGDEDKIVYEKDGKQIVFDIKIKSPDGMLLAARMTRTNIEVGGAHAREKTLSINEAHEQLGHMGEDDTRAAAKELGWTVTRGKFGVCESCAISKAKQKRVKTKEPKEKSDEVNGRIYLDMSRIVSPNAENQPKRPNWCVVVDEKTGFKSSSFHETKGGMVKPTCKKFKNWKEHDMEVKTIRMDNGGENKKLVKTLNSEAWQLYPKIEFTARDTPQHNHLAEVAFATIYGRGRSMMINANIPTEWKPVVAQKAFETATKLDGLVPVTVDGVKKSRVEHWSGQVPKFVKHLRKWGEAGTVKLKTKTTPKMSDRGVTMMMVGYAADHDGDCYEMLNMKTRRIVETRDVTWLGRKYFTKMAQNEVPQIDENSNENNETPESEETTIDEEEEEDEGTDDTGIRTRSRAGRTIRAAPRLIEEYTHITVDEILAVGAGIGGGFSHTTELIPMKYEQAMATPKAAEWVKAVEKEHGRMEEHEVFKIVKNEEVPKEAKVLTSTWAMKQKADGTLRARINARGYEQVAGQHFNETGVSSPVVNEASIFIILILIVMGRMYAELNDVRGAFLNGKFSQGEKLYMHVPKGFEKFYPAGIVLLLLKTIYGLKQAAFEYWKALLEALKAVGLARSKVDPCVYFRWTKNGINIWASWVDDLLSCGHNHDVHEGRKAIKQYFDLDEIGELKEYVGCKVEYDREDGWMKLTQPVLLQSFDDEFNLDGVVGECATPASPNTMLVDGDPKLEEDEHSNYRKGVGKLIHLSKYSRPGILNSVRELSRFCSKPTAAHMKAMYRCMKHCIKTKNKGVMLKPNDVWDGSKDYEFVISGKSDSDFAKCPMTRRSVSGWSTFLNGAPYVRKSKMQKFVTLSVTEAECVAATSCVQDMMFGMRLLESMDLKVKKPMKLQMDNKGGVDIFNNWSIAGNTRAVSVRFAYIRELKEAGILEIEWIAGEKNSADLFTKNVDGATYARHIGEFESE